MDDKSHGAKPPGRRQAGQAAFSLPLAAFLFLAVAGYARSDSAGDGLAGGGLIPGPRGLEVAPMPELPVMDGDLGEWDLKKSLVTNAGHSGPGGRLGDFHVAWLPEGLAVAVTFGPVQGGKSGSDADPDILSMGFALEGERPLMFTLVGIQARGEGGGFASPRVASASTDFPFPPDARFLVGQAVEGGRKVVELFVPAGLFWRDRLEGKGELMVCASLRTRSGDRELFWPRPFKAFRGGPGKSWQRLVLAGQPPQPAEDARPAPLHVEQSATGLAGEGEHASGEGAGSLGLSGTATGSPAAVPGQAIFSLSDLRLSRNSFRPGDGKPVDIMVTIGMGARVTVIIHDRRRNSVRRFPERECPAGTTVFSWDGAGTGGKALAAGSYTVSAIATDGKRILSRVAKIEVARQGAVKPPRKGRGKGGK